MGKARTPGAPWYLRPLALLIAGVLLCVVGVCYGRARLAGRQAEAQRAGQVARPPLTEHQTALPGQAPGRWGRRSFRAGPGAAT